MILKFICLLCFLIINFIHSKNIEINSNDNDNNNDNNVKPNILLFVADDLGYNDLSLTGAPTINTPNIDSLVHAINNNKKNKGNSGSLFSQFIVGGPICTPSRASMFTGRLPIRSGVYSDFDYPYDNLFRVFYPSSVNCLSDDEITIGDALHSVGYSNAMIGKWHLGSNFQNNCLPGRGKQGFDFFYGLPYSHEEGYPGPAPEGLVFPPVPLICDDLFVEQPYNASDLTSRYTNLANLLLRNYANNQKHNINNNNNINNNINDIYDINLEEFTLDRVFNGSLDFSSPFFLHVAYENPHVPLFLSEDYINEYCPDSSNSGSQSCNSRRGLFGDSVEEMDDSIGSILTTLENTGLIDNTIIIFLSDNGAWVHPNNGLTDRPTEGIGPFDGGSNAPFYEGKGSTWEGGFRVPFIVNVPEKYKKQKNNNKINSLKNNNKYIRTPVTLMDVMPTILDYAGIDVTKSHEELGLKKLDGKSLRPLLEGGDNAGPLHDCLYYWREKTLYAIRCGQYKAHFYTRSGFNTSDPPLPHNPPLLFNIEWDSAESIPLNTIKYHEELLVLEKEAERHTEEVYANKPMSLYPQQDISIMPCCPRNGSGSSLSSVGMRNDIQYNSKSNSDNNNDIPDFWEKCVCTRPSLTV